MRTLLLVIGCFTGMLISGQPMLNHTSYPDSLLQLLQNAKNDSTKARLNYFLSDYWSYTDTARAAFYLREGKKAAKNHPYLQALFVFYEALFLHDFQLELAAKKYKEAEKLLEKLPYKEALVYRARAWRNYGTLQQQKDNEQEMIAVILDHAIPLVRKANDLEREGSYYCDVGLVYMNQLLHSKAETFFEKGISLLKKTKPRLETMIVALDNRAKNFCYMDSMQYARPLLNEMGTLLKPYPESEYNIDYTLTQSVYYRKTGNLQAALKSLQTGILLAQKLKQQRQENDLRFQLYKVYTAQGNYRLALGALQTVIKNKQSGFMEDEVMHAFEMSETYARLNDVPSAYTWLKKYSVLRDTMYMRNLKAEIAAVETKFNTAEKEKAIALLQAENKEAALKARNSRLRTSILVIICLAILIILIFVTITYKTSKTLAAQRELNYQQQLKEMEQQRQILTTEAMLEGEERERRRVARDLHDGLGGMLAGIKLKLSSHASSQRYQHRNEQPELSTIINQLDQSVTELRRIARNMMPESLIRFGLQTALKDLCESLMTSETHISFAAFDIDERMELSIQVVIYRIIQEALANAIRHSKAKNIMVQCSQNKNRFYITVEDDGIGFSNLRKDQKGIGLINIENRVKYLNGKIDVISIANEGTTLNMELHVAA
ncbi:histidine kinase [Niabella sp. CC-SYL272]|uniref:tetratricopeptide repeat-containing sensor histidine kinase n=1 Tax=Niabella agricola TaxID=2891571 RepID=UPI001F3A1063|nr:ATP-binding protein [Niabella agricola]MCF3107916.1 histidine kinase [Niabella agricola]